MSKAANFRNSYGASARVAQDKYGINQFFIMSVAAFESGWGASKIAKQANNFFGITSSGKPNNYWFGEKHGASTGLSFRKYTSPQNSFLDYGRLIKSTYKDVAATTNMADFAYEMSESKYITPINGDNRAAYRKGLISCYNALVGAKVQDASNDNDNESGLIILGIGLIGIGFYAK